ncbi:hypothetical protein [Spirosoma oryzicola]|uniref:hypothetical protein n=1 Tax=Spirosoma oryzicola TaxID=2898794 RepID=UPI001E2F03AC|nr:hypothetical protein [Spirosoma oryzicola]UHG90103.1 hypothetical protein LQ777_17845 [Spirosoma oryzicola]
MGVKEEGQNRGPVYTLFMKPYGYGPGTMYCGLFCHHVFVTASVKHGVKGPAIAANWSLPASVIVWRNNRPINGRVPLAGDLALFRFKSKRINHVEVIVNWPSNENYCWVIGGNTSNPNGSGEGVFLKQRLKSEMIVVSRITF